MAFSRRTNFCTLPLAVIGFDELEVAANHHLFETTNDIDEAACIHRRQVAGMQPAFSVNRLGDPLILLLPFASAYSIKNS